MVESEVERSHSKAVGYRFVKKAGGTTRTEIGKKGSVKGVKHTHVEGFGQNTARRHIIHENQDVPPLPIQ